MKLIKSNLQKAHPDGWAYFMEKGQNAERMSKNVKTGKIDPIFVKKVCEKEKNYTENKIIFAYLKK